jgi:kumamolisin
MKSAARSRSRASVLARSLVVLIVVGTLAPAVADAREDQKATPSSPGSQRAARGRSLGPTPPGERIEFDLVLSIPHQAELNAFVDRVNDPASPDYHHYATAEQIGQRFGLSDVDLERVHTWLSSAGLEVVESFPQRTTLRVAGPASAVNRLFHVNLIDRVDPVSRIRYHEPRGDAAVPPPLAGAVQAVAGLNTRPIMRPAPHTVPLATPGSTCLQDAACFTPDRLARTFDITALHDRGMQGDGEYVAVIMDGPVSNADLGQWADTVGVTGVPPIERITVGSGPSAQESGDPLSRLEATMDVETIQAVAPHTKVLYFNASLGAFGDAVNAVVGDGRAHIVNYSAGGCDEMWLADKDARAVRLADAQAVKAAVAAGVNVFASSGDNGAYTCSRFDLKDWRVTASSPSDLPFVVSVGGTFLERGPDGKYLDEAAWEYPLTNSGTGGGLNPLDARPSWQQGPGVDNRYSNGKRQFPDVAAPADPYSGWYIVIGGQGTAAGGTSASSPFWAGLTSLYEQMAKQAGLKGLGFLTPTLYAVAAANPPNTVFHDIVRGGNLFYETTPGWDYATGLGTPIASKLGDAIVAYLRSNQPAT